MADQQGNLSRQEAVSMIPPLFLNVEPHHRVSNAIQNPAQTDDVVSRHVCRTWFQGEYAELFLAIVTHISRPLKSSKLLTHTIPSRQDC
jgi:multisite-specific tRNA:(cytosine-C5)-methyltransferase